MATATTTAHAGSRAFHFLHADDDDMRRARHARHTRHHAHLAAVHRISAHRHAETARWSRAWAEAAAQEEARRERERGERAERARVEAARAEEVWNDRRMKAKGGRVELRVVRVQMTDPDILPELTSAFLVCQPVQAPALAGGMDYPTPLAPAVYQRLHTRRHRRAGHDAAAPSPSGLARVRSPSPSIANASVVLACQCADEEQARRWMKKKAKLERRTR